MLFNSLSFRCKVIDLQPEEILCLLFSSWISSSQFLLLSCTLALLCLLCVTLTRARPLCVPVVFQSLSEIPRHLKSLVSLAPRLTLLSLWCLLIVRVSEMIVYFCLLKERCLLQKQRDTSTQFVPC